MNIFFLDPDPNLSAQFNVDRHVVKIITEINQCLSTCYENGKAPYRHSHFNHPICKWIRQSLANYNLSIDYCDSLCKEYTYRYGKIHKGELILKFFKDNKPIIDNIGVTEIPRCFGVRSGAMMIILDNRHGAPRLTSRCIRGIGSWTLNNVAHGNKSLTNFCHNKIHRYIPEQNHEHTYQWR